MDEVRAEAGVTWWKRPEWLVPLACAALALAALGLWPWWRAGRERTPPPLGPEGIRVQTVSTREFEEHLPWLGRVEGVRSVRVVALEAGRVEKVVARDGASVREGDVLFRVAGPELGPRLTSAEGEVRSLEARLAQAAGTVRRREEAVRDEVGDPDALAAARSDEAALKARLAGARSRLALLRSQSVLRAPVAGVFTDRTVNPGQDVTAGTVLAELVDPSDVRVAATVYGATAAALRGAEASVESEGRTVEARVAQVFPDASPAGGARVWIEGPALSGLMLPGGFVAGTVRPAPVVQVPAVPRQALVYDEGEHPYVFLQEGGSFVQTPVALGLTDRSWAQVTSGVKPGDRVVTEGAYELYYRDFGKTYQVED